MRLRRERHEQLGLCKSCKNRAEDGHKYCQKHIDKHKERARLNAKPKPTKTKIPKGIYAKQRRENLLSQGLCGVCGLSKVVEGKTSCTTCLERVRNFNRERRARLELSGLCVHCGKNKQLEDSNACELCYYKRIAHDVFNNMAMAIDLKDLMEMQNHTCPYTGETLKIGSNTELDHIIPKSRGGENTIDNVHWVLSSVNQMKHSLLESEFFDLIKKISKFRRLS